MKLFVILNIGKKKKNCCALVASGKTVNKSAIINNKKSFNISLACSYRYASAIWTILCNIFCYFKYNN